METGATTYEPRSTTAGSRSEYRDETRRREHAPPRDRGARNGGPERLARALGWFSLGLGLAELAAPQQLSRLIGIADTNDRRRLMRALGVRGLVSGAGILRGRRQAGWLWSRVGGDAIDLGLLGRAFGMLDADRRRLTPAALAVAGVTALDVLASERLSRRLAQGIRMRRTITIDRPAEELYRLWRDLSQLPRIFGHLESVELTGDGRSHWKAKGPAGTTIEWDAEVVDDQPNRRIAWRSLEGARVPNRGVVEFVPASGNRGTIVRVELEYDPPGGALGAAVAKLFGEEPGGQIAEDLRRLKQRLETGEIATARGPSGRRRRSLSGGEARP
jgi:uncharacterized membrane protein